MDDLVEGMDHLRERPSEPRDPCAFFLSPISRARKERDPVAPLGKAVSYRSTRRSVPPLFRAALPRTPTDRGRSPGDVRGGISLSFFPTLRQTSHDETVLHGLKKVFHGW